LFLPEDKKKGEDKEGKDKKKSTSKDRNGNMVKNTLQPDAFKLITGILWKENFATILLHNQPAWTDKIKMCTRWHIKGSCYDDCSRAI
jgi:hypothetical protein